MMDKPWGAWWAILWGFALNSDCQRLLVMQGVYLNQNGSLNCTVRWFSVCDFSLENLEMAYAVWVFLGRASVLGSLHICFVMSIHQNYGHWSLAIMLLILPWTPFKQLAIFVSNLNFVLIIGCTRIWKVNDGVSKQFNTKYIP